MFLHTSFEFKFNLFYVKLNLGFNDHWLIILSFELAMNHIHAHFLYTHRKFEKSWGNIKRTIILGFGEVTLMLSLSFFKAMFILLEWLYFNWVFVRQWTAEMTNFELCSRVSWDEWDPWLREREERNHFRILMGQTTGRNPVDRHRCQRVDNVDHYFWGFVIRKTTNTTGYKWNEGRQLVLL